MRFQWVLNNRTPYLFLFSLIMVLGLLVPALAFETLIDDANGVRVDVKPIQLEAGKEAVFKVWLNTHSVPLEYDMENIAVLRDDQGNEYRPLKWKGSAPGGHHRRGKLEFPAIEGAPRTLKLILKDIAGVPERTFQWELAR